MSTEEAANEKISMENLLLKLVKEDASDLHCTVGVPPSIRKNGKLIRLNAPPLKPGDVSEYAEYLLKNHQEWSTKTKMDYDLAYNFTDVGRFRINIYWQRNSPVIACRRLMEKTPTIDELGLPYVMEKYALSRQGLILVTGPTGQGKTTSLAALINVINEQKECNIITLEDPIEYMHHHKKSNVNQREVGQDCDSFGHGLRRILRQDPDVIMIGEMRDLESISIAVSAAETGHLVLSTLHTNSAISSIDRIVDTFPGDQQNQIRSQLAESLLIILSQRLIPGVDGKRELGYELLLNSIAVQNAIREKKTHTVDSIIQTSSEQGMVTFDQRLCSLCAGEKITFETGLAYANNPKLFQDLMRNKGKGQQPPYGNQSQNYKSLSNL